LDPRAILGVFKRQTSNNPKIDSKQVKKCYEKSKKSKITVLKANVGNNKKKKIKSGKHAFQNTVAI